MGYGEMSKWQYSLIFAFGAVLTLAMLGPLMTFWSSGPSGDGTPARQALYVLLFLVIIVAVRPQRDLSRLRVIPIPILVALAWCGISLVWALDPGVAFRRLVLTTLIIASVFTAVANMRVEQTTNLMRIILAGTLVASYIAVFAYPALGVHQSNTAEDSKLVGDWAGILGHKNIAGSVCAVTILMFTFDAQKLRPLVRIAVIAAAAYFLFRSQSKTSMGMLGGALIIGFLFQVLTGRLRIIAILIVSVVVIASVLIVYLYPHPLEAKFDDPEAFTGRVAIWQAMWKFFTSHPWTGAGFGSFWNISGNNPIYSYAAGWVATIGAGHSGYMDLLVTIGIPGLVLVVFAMIIYPFMRVFTALGTSSEGAWPLSVLFFGIGHNFTESSLFDRDVIINVVMLVSIAAIERMATRMKTPRRAGARGGSNDLRELLRA